MSFTKGTFMSYRKTILLGISCFCLMLVVTANVIADEWKPVEGILLSRFAKDVDPKAPLPEYPRPQLVRSEWLNLNGLWNYAIAPVDQELKAESIQDGSILVPFAAESALSGVAKKVGKENNLWYRRDFVVPANWGGKRIQLNFGAVDWRCTVFVNGQEVGGHEGGYTPFSIDITPALKKEDNARQLLVVKVWDPTNEGPIPHGKQTNKPQGIFYTSVTGIWRTVWLEPLPEASIDAVQVLTSSKESDLVEFQFRTHGVLPSDQFRISGSFGTFTETKILGSSRQAIGISATFKKGELKFWTPETPILYPFKLELIRNGKVLDTVDSYFAFREISLGKTPDGILRILLNGKFVFQHGLLDQGWWPDGLYTAPTDKALQFDLEKTKAFGFNMLRKHVKVEPDRFYYHCDRLGILVWQDMPSSLDNKSVPVMKPDNKKDPEYAKNYERELAEMIHHYGFFPSIVIWVPFNEGWGQYDTERITELTRKLDPTRLINAVSGWNDRRVGDIYDTHAYPGPTMTVPELNRAVVLGEYGGLGLALKGHSWKETNKNWGYVKFDDQEKLFQKYNNLNVIMRALIARGLSAAVYTQTTDVETEVNGLMSYDRQVIKMPEEKVFASNVKLRGPIPDQERENYMASNSWNGFRQDNIQFFYRDAKVTYPKKAAPGKPWIWRARFFGHEPQMDIALLEKGFHLVWIDTTPTLGSPNYSVRAWQEFYLYLTECLGLSKKANLEGMSRGGLYSMNWAASYPDQVAAIYLDNPVLDARSWPGKSSPKDWADYLKSYELTEEAALTYDKNPVDTCTILAEKKIPIILLLGDQDTVVPPAENGLILKEKYEKMGAPIEVIMKPGCGHHPHSLKDPKPLVEFFLKHNGLSEK